MPILSHDIIEGSESKEVTIRVNDCIALCHIVDGFEVFVKNLYEFSKGSKGGIYLDNLYKYINDGKNVNKKVRNFYLGNYKVLDAIHKNSFISNFLLIYFNRQTGKFNKEITTMYEYINNNKENKNRILEILEKLKKLGFNDFKFYPSEKFMDTYTHSSINDKCYYYLDGEIEIIPTLYNLKYRSKGANYEIEMCSIPFHNPEITLNNLLFDPSNLPNHFGYNEMMGKIIALKNEKQESYNVLCDTVQFSYNLETITPILEKIDEIVEHIHNCEYKNIAKEHIDIVKNSISELQQILEVYECDIVDKGLVKSEVLEKEKINYKKRTSN